MTTPTFTPPPTAPARSQSRDVFVANADAFLAWLVAFAAQMIAAVSWFVATAAQVAADAASTLSNSNAAQAAANAAVGATTYVASSTSSIALTNTAQAIAFAEAGRTFANGDQVNLVRRSDASVRGSGIVSLANMGAKTMTVTFASWQGSGGPYTDWLIVLADLDKAAVAVAADVSVGTDAARAITPKALSDATVPQALTDASTVVFNRVNGVNANLLLTTGIGSTRLIGAPMNPRDGDVLSIDITQPASGGPLAVTWNTGAGGWDFGSLGVPGLATAAGATTTIVAKYTTARNKAAVIGVWKSS